MPFEDRPPPTSGFLSKTGNYRDLLSYRKSEIIYNFTFRFCQKFLTRGDRTIDQMVHIPGISTPSNAKNYLMQDTSHTPLRQSLGFLHT